jgi:hypothetical protein
VVDEQEPTGERQPGDADPVVRRSAGGRSDPMGVVLRLPSGRGRAGPAEATAGAATIEPPATTGAAGEADEPVDGTTPDQPPPDGAEPADVTQWAGSPDEFGGFAGSGDPARSADAAESAGRADWAWVEEWRAGNEPTPWATGLVLTVFSALVVGVAVWVLAAGLSDRPVVAVLVNLLVAGGLAPAIWLSRGLPVLRWMGAGAAAGIVIGWIAALLMLPLPTP